MKVVFHADDFGLLPGINAGIIEAHEQGVLGSTSLMVTADAVADAVALAAAHPTLDVGLHLTLVEERPVLPLEEVRSLVDGDRFWSSHPTVAMRYARGQWNPTQATRELEAQWDRCAQLGIAPSHCDGHQHLHLLPQVFPAVVAQARQRGVAFVRTWLGDPWQTPGRLARRGIALAMAGLGWWSWSRVGNQTGVRPFTTIGFIGAGGRLTVDGVMTALEWLRQCRRPPEVVEVMMHPGRRDAAAVARYGHWHYDWENDLALLCDQRLRAWLPERGFEGTSFRALAAGHG